MYGGLLEMESSYNQIVTAPAEGYQRYLKCKLNGTYCEKTRNGFYVKFKIVELNNAYRKGSMKIKWMCQKNGLREF